MKLLEYICTFYGHESCSIGRIYIYIFFGGGGSKKSILFAHYFEELSINVHCTWPSESINKKMARGDGCEGSGESIIWTNLWNC